jgi:hypothetical protein
MVANLSSHFGKMYAFGRPGVLDDPRATKVVPREAGEEARGISSSAASTPDGPAYGAESIVGPL